MLAAEFADDVEAGQISVVFAKGIAVRICGVGYAAESAVRGKPGAFDGGRILCAGCEVKLVDVVCDAGEGFAMHSMFDCDGVVRLW